MSNKKKYIVIEDAFEYLTYGLNIKEIGAYPEIKSIIKNIEESSCQKLQEIVKKNINIIQLNSTDLSLKLIDEAKKNYPESIIICLDRSYLPEAQHINITTEYGGRLVPYYKTDSFLDQINMINVYLKNKNLSEHSKGIVLIDVGISSGDTLIEILNKLKEERMPINGIIVGLASYSGLFRINELGYDVKVIEPMDWVDWIDSRDLLLIDGMQEPELIADPNLRRFVPLYEIIERDPNTHVAKNKFSQFKNICKEGNSQLLASLKEFKIEIKNINKPISINEINQKLINYSKERNRQLTKE
ncbi:MAG: hypothetical protein M1331_00470 [Candidatus Marsarchaeota archaeon]|nr:hypothetical protein [Candidatus Marsarchaeota archaeon]